MNYHDSNTNNNGITPAIALINEYPSRKIYQSSQLKRFYPEHINHSNPLMADYLKLPRINQYNPPEGFERKTRKKQFDIPVYDPEENCYNKERKRLIMNPYSDAHEYQPIKVLNTEVIEKAFERKRGMRPFDIISHMPVQMPCLSSSSLDGISEGKRYFSIFEKYDARIGRNQEDPRRILNRCFKLSQIGKGDYIKQLRRSVNPKFIHYCK